MSYENNYPSQDVLNAFNVQGEPILLQGGEGTCYRVGDIVFKPTGNEAEAIWLAEFNNGIVSDDFRVPRSLKATDGSWIYDGWTASEFLVGEHRPGNYAEAKDLCQKFHQAIADVPRPDYFDQRSDVFFIADKIAWGELPLPDFEMTNEPFKKIVSLLKENKLPNQLIHGDWGIGQILFHDSLLPAVIDMTPYFRPADYPIADMVISALDHEGADESILDLGNDIAEFDQLLLRALLFRTNTYVGFQIHPENERDWTAEIERHLNIFDLISNKI